MRTPRSLSVRQGACPGQCSNHANHVIMRERERERREEREREREERGERERERERERSITKSKQVLVGKDLLEIFAHRGAFSWPARRRLDCRLGRALKKPQDGR